VGRIRTIKPEFPHSESMGRVSREARLLFIQLWTIADDDGRLRAAPQFLAGQLYPYDEDARGLLGGWLDELEREACIHRYEHDGTRYLEIMKWRDHQKIDKPARSRLPAPPCEPSEVFANTREPSAGPREASASPREASASPREPSSMDLGPWTLEEDLGLRTLSLPRFARRPIHAPNYSIGVLKPSSK
jgi:hypothetical protein